MLRPLLMREAFPEMPNGSPKPPSECAFCKAIHGVETAPVLARQGVKVISKTLRRPLFVAELPMRPRWITCRACAMEGKKATGLNSEFAIKEVAVV